MVTSVCDAAHADGVFPLMTEIPDDATVIGRVLAGDREAFALLCSRYQDSYARYATTMLGGRAEADDVIQESLFRAWRALDRCRDRTQFKAWLFRIVRNQCLTALGRRRGRSEASLDDVADALESGEATAEALERAQERRRVRAALMRLEAREREVLVLKYVEELPVNEIADALGISLSAVKMRLMRARAALKEVLDAEARA